MALKLPTQAGRRALLNIAAGRSSADGLNGISAFGSHRGTMESLRRRGLVTPGNELTNDGLQMIERLTVIPEVAHVA